MRPPPLNLIALMVSKGLFRTTDRAGNLTQFFPLYISLHIINSNSTKARQMFNRHTERSLYKEFFKFKVFIKLTFFASEPAQGHILKSKQLEKSYKK